MVGNAFATNNSGGVRPSFNYLEHALNFEGLNLFSLHFEEQENIELKNELNEAKNISIYKELFRKELKLKNLLQTESKKRVRVNKSSFEDPSTPKILNTDERLDQLQKHKELQASNQKKTARSKTTKVRSRIDDEIGKRNELKKVKLQDIENKSIISEFDTDSNEEISRGRQTASFSLDRILPDLISAGLYSDLISETTTQEMHSLYLPIGFETTNLKSKSELVSFFHFFL